jgi:putative ABC transport system permease protein
MALPVPLRFALRELRGGLRGFAIFLLCLAFGVTAIAAVGTVRTSIMTGLADQGSAILSGDAQLEFTYRFASDQEQRWMFDQSNRVSEIADFRSMAVVSNDGVSERALTQVKAVDDLYPLVGTVTLSPDMTLSDALEGGKLGQNSRQGDGHNQAEIGRNGFARRAFKPTVMANNRD